MDDSLVRSMVLIEDAEVNFKMILLTIYMYQHFGRWYKGCPSLPVLHFFNIVQTAFDPPLLPPPFLLIIWKKMLGLYEGICLSYYEFCRYF